MELAIHLGKPLTNFHVGLAPNNIVLLNPLVKFLIENFEFLEDLHLGILQPEDHIFVE